MPWADGPFRVLQHIGENAYKIELPGDYGVLPTFNVSDLSPYYEDQEDQVDLGESLHQPGETDTGVSNKPNLVLKPNFSVPKPNKWGPIFQKLQSAHFKLKSPIMMILKIQVIKPIFWTNLPRGESAFIRLSWKYSSL